MDTGSRKAVLAAMLANGGIACGKFVGFAFTGASSMLAEAVHSSADTANQGLLLWGGTAAQRPATDQFAFGHGRERFFWCFVVALVIFSLGGLFAIYEGIEKLLHPHPLQYMGWAVLILGLSVVLESFSFRTAIVEANKQKGSEGWFDFIRGTKNPELPVVLMEDLGALLGLLLALIGVGLAWQLDDPRFDAIGSICIGLLLVTTGVGLSLKMKGLLIGESATLADEAAIRAALLASPEVLRVIHMRTQHIGPEEILLGAKVEFDHRLSMRELALAIDAAELRIRAQVPDARMIFLEPDLYRVGEHPVDAVTGADTD